MRIFRYLEFNGHKKDNNVKRDIFSGAGETNLIVRSASHLPLILPVLRAYCSNIYLKWPKKHCPIGKNIKIFKLFASNPI